MYEDREALVLLPKYGVLHMSNRVPRSVPLFLRYGVSVSLGLLCPSSTQGPHTSIGETCPGVGGVWTGTLCFVPLVTGKTECRKIPVEKGTCSQSLKGCEGFNGYSTWIYYHLLVSGQDTQSQPGPLNLPQRPRRRYPDTDSNQDPNFTSQSTTLPTSKLRWSF